MKWLCKIGLHSWEYTPAEYKDGIMRDLGIPNVNGSRCCNRCGKKQTEHIHCLGLNPPEYVIHYR